MNNKRANEKRIRSPVTGPAPLWKRGWFPGLLLVVAITAAYWTVGHAGFIWDDGLYISNDPLLSAPDGLRRIWFTMESPCQYFPMVYTVFRFEYDLWGVNPAGYHWVNVLLHAVNAVLLWRLLLKLGVPGAWLAAALFGLHPVQVESVAWVSELKNVMSLFFSLLSLHAWVNYLEGRTGWIRRWDWLALAWYIPALMSKTTACTLPATLLLLCWLREKQLNGKRFLEMIPFLLAGVAMGLVSVWWEATLGGTTGTTFALSWFTRLLIASHAVWFYLGKLLWPAHLLLVYPRWQIDPSDPRAYGWLLAAATMAAAIYAFASRGVKVAMLFFVATLSPLLGFVMLYTFRFTFVADHWQYVACIGPLTLVAAGLARSFRTVPRGIKAVLCIALLLGLGTLTFRQAKLYTSSETVWSATVAGNPNSSIGHLNLGFALAQRGDTSGAASHYEKAIAVDLDNAEAHEDLGVLQLHAGQIDESMKQFRQALALRPDFADAYSDLGTAWMRKRQLEMAARFVQYSLDISPDSSVGHFNMGNIRKQQGRVPEAIEHYRRAVELDPNSVDAWNNLAVLLIQAGNVDEAASCLKKVALLNPNTPEAHSNLGNLLLRQGHDTAAVEEFKKAAELGPDLFQVWNNLAWVMATSRDTSLRNGPKAVQFATRADQLSGGENVTVLNTLATAYALTEDYTRAAATVHRAEKVAAAQGNTALADQLRKQAELYEARQSGLGSKP